MYELPGDAGPSSPRAASQPSVVVQDQPSGTRKCLSECRIGESKPSADIGPQSPYRREFGRKSLPPAAIPIGACRTRALARWLHIAAISAATASLETEPKRSDTDPEIEHVEQMAGLDCEVAHRAHPARHALGVESGQRRRMDDGKFSASRLWNSAPARRSGVRGGGRTIQTIRSPLPDGRSTVGCRWWVGLRARLSAD